MRRLMLMLMSTLVLALTATASPAREKQPELSSTTDRRLAQVVRVSIRGEPLGEALRTLREQTGISLTAARDLADLRVMLLAKGLPLQRLLTEIAELLDLTWSRSGSAPQYQYECLRSLSATRRGQDALEQARAANRAATQAQLRRIAEAFRKRDLASLAATDPEISMVLDDPGRSEVTQAVFEFIALFPPEAVQDLARTGELTLSYDQMPREAREYLRKQAEKHLPVALGNVRGADGNSDGYETFLKSARYTLGVAGLDYGGKTYYAQVMGQGLNLRTKMDLSAYTANLQVADAATATVPSTGGPAERGGATGSPVPPAAPQTQSPAPAAPAGGTLPPPAVAPAGGKLMSVREIGEWLGGRGPSS